MDWERDDNKVGGKILNMNTGSREIYTELFDKERITEEQIGRRGKEESIGI